MFISSKIEIQKSDEEMCIVLDNLEEKFKQKLQYAARIDLHFPVRTNEWSILQLMAKFSRVNPSSG